LDPTIFWQTDPSIIDQNREPGEGSYSRANDILPIGFLRNIKVNINRLPTNLVCDFLSEFITNISQHDLCSLAGEHPCFSFSLSSCRAGNQRHLAVEPSRHGDSSLVFRCMNAQTHVLLPHSVMVGCALRTN